MTDQLQIQDITIGNGKPAVRGSLITAHYTGYLADGTVFDSSHQRGQPFETVIGTGRVIKGWDIGVLGGDYAKAIGYDSQLADPNLAPMQVGGKRKLVVPSHLGYGERQIGKIPANSDLTFDIELLDVKTRDE